MRQAYRIKVELTLLGPILTRNGTNGEPGIDAPLARDGLGRPFLPFSLIKGKVREACSELGYQPDWLKEWFGQPTGADLEPERARLRFTDFVTETAESSEPGIIERIALDPNTDSTIEQMLAFVEAPFGYDQKVEFEGFIDLIASPEELPELESMLGLAFRWVPMFGALRTTGFGRTDAVGLKRSDCPERSSGTPCHGPVLPIQLELDRPLCVIGRNVIGNHFESLETISGAVLKGATAQLIRELCGKPGNAPIEAGFAGPHWPMLCEHFEKIRFAEARPRPKDTKQRSVEPPISIVTVSSKPGQCFDVALETEPKLIDDLAPAFAMDWKEDDYQTVNSRYRTDSPARELRTRTAIEADKGRALDESLFSYSLVLPRFLSKDGTTIKEYLWEGSIGLEGIADKHIRAEVANELQDLLRHGLPGIGKTKAIASVEWLLEPTPWKVAAQPLPQSTQKADLHRVTLQTDALMTDPRTLANTERSDRLFEAYKDFWIKASDGAFELVRFFARQSLHGGFLARRVRRGSYKPYLLTERGSTFVLRVVEPTKAATCMKDWQTAGLPVPAWVKEHYAPGPVAPLWQSCPFLPAAGFGEVLIDLDLPTCPDSGDARP